MIHKHTGEGREQGTEGFPNHLDLLHIIILDLATSETEVKESYYRLQHLEDDWDTPGMEAYDQL